MIHTDIFGDKLGAGELVYYLKNRTGCCKLTNWHRLPEELKADFNEKPEVFQFSLW